MTNGAQRPPTISIDELRLRPARSTDAPDLYSYLRDPAVTALTSFPPVTISLVESMIEKWSSRWAAGDLSKLAITLADDDRVIGTCGFNDGSRNHGWAELAYDLARDHWGKGRMSKVIAALLDWTFRHDSIHRVHAYVRVDNARSWQLLGRMGFMREGCLRSFRICGDRAYDFYLYALLRSDWEKAQRSNLEDGSSR